MHSFRRTTVSFCLISLCVWSAGCNYLVPPVHGGADGRQAPGLFPISDKAAHDVGNIIGNTVRNAFPLDQGRDWRTQGTQDFGK
jgi:hypothetical protein